MFPSILIAQADRFALATTIMAALAVSVVAILLVVALVGIFRNPALRPGTRAAWVVAVIVIPVFGPIAYLLLSPRTAIRKAEPRR